MTLNEDQQEAMGTCMFTCENFSYMMLNLVGEVGEFASKIAKHIRKQEVDIRYNHLVFEQNNIDVKRAKKELMKEAGDILWQLAGLCEVMDWSLEDVAQMNLGKLASRQERGVISGDGDNR